MSILASMELIGVVAGLAATAFFLFGRQRRFSSLNRALFGILLVTVLANNIIDVVEQTGSYKSLDLIEDYLDMLMMLIWGIFIFSLFPEYSTKTRREGDLHRVFTRQLTFVFTALLVLNVIYSVSSFFKSRNTLESVRNDHGPGLVSLIDMRRRSNDAIQESFAYAISGDVTEKEEFEVAARAFTAQVEAFRSSGFPVELAGPDDLAMFEAIVASQHELMDATRGLFAEYETTGGVSQTSFRDYEVAIDALDDNFNKLEQSRRARDESSRSNATLMLEETSVELLILGAISIVLCVSLFVLLSFSFRRYSAEQEFARRELAESDHRHRLFLDNLPELIWVAGADKRCTFFNATWLEFTGQTLEQAQEHGWAVGIHSDDVADCLKAFEAAFEAREPFTIEYRRRRKDGRDRWLLDIGTPSLGPQNQFTGFIGGCIDITERRQAGEALRQRDHAFRTAITPIVFGDLDGRITEANQAFADLFGFEDVSQLIGMPNTDFHSEPIAMTQINAAIIENGGFDGEITSKRIDSTPIEIQVSATLFTGDDGRPLGSMATMMDVTPRRNVERALRNSEQHYRTLVESAPEAILVLDVDERRFIDVNPSAMELFRLERHHLLEVGPSELSPELQPDGCDSAKTSMALIQRALAGEMPNFEWVHIDSEGNEISCEVRLARLASTRRLVRASVTDITERRENEEIEANLGRIVEESLNEIYIFDAETLKFRQANRGARENLGYSMEELSELTPLDLKPEITDETFAELIQPLRSAEQALIQFKTRHRRKDGSRYDVEVRLQMATYQRKPVFVAMILDVSERLALENALSRRALEAELLYQAVVMADATDSLDAALQKCLDIVCEMTLWPIGHAYVPSINGSQLEPTKIWHLGDEQRFVKFREVTEQAQFVIGEGLPGRIWKSGEPAWIVNAQKDINFPRNLVLEDLGVKGAFGFPVKIRGEIVAILEFFHEEEVEKNDVLLLLVQSVGEQVGRVIERKEAADASHKRHELVTEELERAKDELILKTRLAAIGQMSAQIAHEMRNPLGAISNAIYYLKRQVPASESKWSEYLRLMDGEVATCNRFIGDLLEVTRTKIPSRETANLATLIDHVAARHEIPQNVDLQVRCQPDPFEIFADKDQIVQVIDNLLKNSLDAIGEHSGRIEIHAHCEGESDIITVADSGKGILPEHRAFVFDVLFTAKPAGTGLGLPICKQIIERHGGTIELVHTSSPGAEFQIRLPRQHAFS